jgi:hypothetical protein
VLQMNASLDGYISATHDIIEVVDRNLSDRSPSLATQRSMPACLEINLGILGPILTGVGSVLLHFVFNQ